MRRIIQLSLLALLVAPVPLRAGILQVRHDHDPWGRCKGELEISENGIEFRSQKKKHSRDWGWLDIQSFDRISEGKFSILTWHDQKWKLGLDRSFDFTVLPDSGPLGSADFERIRDGVEGTVTERIPRDFQSDYSIPVKHLHGLGGCEGTLKFGPGWIVYQTDHPRDARTWSREREVQSVWSLHRYQLEIHVFEENRREFDKTRRFRFQLKRPLDEEYYSQLRREFLPAR